MTVNQIKHVFIGLAILAYACLQEAWVIDNFTVFWVLVAIVGGLWVLEQFYPGRVGGRSRSAE